MASWNPAAGTGGGGATQQLVLSNTTLSLVPGGGSVVLPTGVVSSVNTLLVSSLIANQEIFLPDQQNPLIRILSTGQIIAQRVDAPIIGGTLGSFSEVDVSMINATSGSITDLYVENLTGQKVEGYQVKGNYFNANDRTLIIPGRSWYNPIDGHIEITTNVEYGSNGAGVPLVLGVPAYAMSTLYANEFISPEATITTTNTSTITMGNNGSNITTSGTSLTYGGQVITTGNQGNAANWAQYPANAGYINFNNGSLNNINGISAQAGNMSILENYQNEQRSVTVGRFNNTFTSYQPNVAIGSRNTTIAAGVDQLLNASAGYFGEGSKIQMDAYPGVVQSLVPGYNADSQINLTAHGGYDYSIPNPFPPPTSFGVSGGRGQINLTAYNSYYYGVVPNPLNRGQIRLNAALVSVGNNNTLPFGETQNVDIQAALVQVIAGSVGLPNPFGVTGTIFRSRNGVGIRNIDPSQNLDSRLFVRELWGMAISPGDLDVGDRSLFIQAQGSQGVQMSNASFIHGQNQYGNPGLVITNLTTATGNYPASVQAQLTALQNQITNISTTGGVSSLTLWSLYPAISTLQTQRNIAMFGTKPSISTTNGLTLTDFSGSLSYLNTGVLALGRIGQQSTTNIALVMGSDNQTMGVYTTGDFHLANVALSTIKFNGSDSLNVSSGTLFFNGTPVGSGWTGKATTDLNMAGYNITSPSTLTVAAKNLTLQANGATAPAAVVATGGTITYSGGYTYHTFTSDGTFTLTTPTSLAVEVLVVGGGGGGGGLYACGGGGAGEAVQTTLTISSATSVVVGAGGTQNTNGSSSSFFGVTAIGGGAGNGNGAGGNGACGGGGSSYLSGAGGIASVGFGGGAGTNTYGARGGGGGGMGSAGSSGTNIDGGAGQTYTLGGVSYTLAGGGGGGSYGSAGAGQAGGGTGGTGSLNATSATANSGSGGGGDGGTGGGGGNGGSGIVIIAYPSTYIQQNGSISLQATDTTTISTVSMSIQATGDINIAAANIALSNVSSINGVPYTTGGGSWVGTATSDLDMQSYKISGCNAGNMLGTYQPFKFTYEPPTAAGQFAEFAIQAHPQDAGVVYNLRYGVDMAAGTAYLSCEWPGYIVVPITITGQNVTMNAGENAYVNSGGYVNINSVYGTKITQSNTGGTGLLTVNATSNLLWNGTQLDGGGGGGWIGTAQSDLNMNGYNIISQSNLNISTGSNHQINLIGDVYINGKPFAAPSTVYASTIISPNLNVSSITFNGGNRIISSLINFSTADLRISSINGLQPGPANWAAYPVYPNTAISFGPESVWIKGTGNGIFTDLTGNNSIPITAQSFVAFNPAVNNGLGRFTIDQDGTPAILGGASQLNNLRVSTLYISTNAVQADSQNIYVNGVNPVTNWWEYNTAYSTLTVALSADGVNPITTGSSFPSNGSYITIENLNGFQTTSMNLSDSLGNTYPNPSPLPGPYESYTFQLTNTIPSGGDLALVVYTSQGPWYCQITNNSGTATVGFTGDRNAYTVGTPASASGKALTINTQGTTYPTAISIINDTTQGTDLVVASNVTQNNRPLRMWATNAGILNIDNNGATGISLNQNTLTTTNLQATLVNAPTVTATVMSNKSTLTSNIIFPDIEGIASNVLYGNRFGLYYQGVMLATASNTSNWSHFPANSNIDLNSNSIIGVNSNTSNSPASFYALDMSNLANYIHGTPQGTTTYGIRISNSNQVGSNNFAPQVTLFTDNVVGGGGITSVDTSYGGSYPQPFAMNVGSLTCSASNFNFPSFTTGAFGQTTLTPNSLTSPTLSATYAGFSTLTVSSLVVSIPGTYAYTGLAGFQIAPYFWSVDGGAYIMSTIAIRPADATPSVAWGPVTIDSGVTDFGTASVTVNISGSVSNAFPAINVVPQSRWGVLTGVLNYSGISGSIAQLTRIGLGNLSDTGGNCVFQVMTGIPSANYGGPIGISLTVDFNTFNLRSDSVTVKFGTTYPGTYTLTNVGIRWLGPGGWTG